MKRGSSVNMTYKEHFEYALLNRLDLLELDLKGSSQYLFIIVFLVYKIQKLQMELLETNPNVKIHIDSGPFLLSENSLMTVLSYFTVHEQLEMQKVNKRLRFLVARTQESRRFRVSYFTQEYTDTRKLHNAHQNLGYSPRIRFLLSALYFAVSKRH